MPINFDLGEYVSHTFVETGTFQGDGVIRALHSGFRKVYSVEISEELYQTAQQNVSEALKVAPRQCEVVLCHGDGISALPHICSQIQHESATFWLDAHTHYFDDGRISVGAKPCPLIEEIAIIGNYFRDSQFLPIILIDDLRCIKDAHSWGGHGVTVHGIIDAILAISSDYQFKFLNGIIPHDVLAAIPPARTEAKA